MKFAVGIQRRLRQRQARRRRIRLFLYALATFAVLALFIYIPLFSGAFTNKEITVSGTEALAAKDIQAAIREVLGARANLLFFSPGEGEALLRERFPRLEAVTVTKKLFARTVAVAVTERAPAGIACDKDREGACAYFDAKGVVFAEAPFITGVSLLTIKETGLPSAELFPYERYTAPMIAFMGRTKNAIRERAGVTVAWFSPMKYEDIEAVALEGFRIQLSMEQDAEKQAQILKNLLTMEIKDKAPQLEYIDLRVENRAYYKIKE